MLSKSTTGFIAGGGITYADVLLFNMLDWLSLASNVGLWPTPGYPLLQAHYAKASARGGPSSSLLPLALARPPARSLARGAVGPVLVGGFPSLSAPSAPPLSAVCRRSQPSRR